MKSLLAQGNYRERTSKVASDPRSEEWQPTTDAVALSQLRSLIRSYIRGELSHSAFVMRFGVQGLTHDLGTLRPASTFEVYHDKFVRCTSCGYPVPRVFTIDELADLAEGSTENMVCEAPAAHDGSGDCGCPAVAED